MSTDSSQGGLVSSPGEQKNVNLLLIGSSSSDADLMKKEMGLITGLSYTAWYRPDLEQGIDFIKERQPEIDVIFLDLSLFNADYPKERFLQIKKNIPDVPIVVVTDRTDYDLIQFVMEEGAADNISRWQIRSDPDRLRNIVQSCCARNRIHRREHQINQDALDRSGIELRDERDRGDSALKQVAELKRGREQDVVALGVLNDEISQLNENASQHHAGLLEERHSNATSLQEMQGKHKVLAEANTEYAALLQTSKDENTQLRRDIQKSGLDRAEDHRKGDALKRELRNENALLRNHLDAAYDNLKRGRMTIVNGPDNKALAEALEENEKLRADLQAASALLVETVKKSDAVLLYAQEKGKFDLKKIREQNLALRKYNDYAREWLSGNYSTYPKDDEDDEPGEDAPH